MLVEAMIRRTFAAFFNFSLMLYFCFALKLSEKGVAFARPQH